MANIDGNEIINGKYGHLYDENGQENQTVQEFEANVEFAKEEIQLPGQFLSTHKVMGGTGSGSMTFLKIDSRLQKKIADNPTAKFVFRGVLADPTSRGQEAVLLRGVSFDSAPLMHFAVDSNVEVSLDFTFDAFNYVQTI
ncbi:phage tail tube protein [Paenibacillus sinopodophylli]|uniref:phage tail tube protein n=1 Tax=Paenibacillus sinopodophylli TaxID=1837342 RepID=UPI00110D05D2|nr:phage tail tube protein [Paenibacillus sinopodophylli]